MASGEMPSSLWCVPHDCAVPLFEVKATMACCGSTRAVTMAMAAEAMRGVSPGTPAMAPMPIDPETSSARSHRLLVGSTKSKAA
jgi:hypothetical protein